jgi:hypothetical protein
MKFEKIITEKIFKKIFRYVIILENVLISHSKKHKAQKKISSIVNSISKEEYERTFQMWIKRIKLYIQNKRGSVFIYLKLKFLNECSKYRS